MYPFSCANTRHDVANFTVDGMFRDSNIFEGKLDQ